MSFSEWSNKDNKEFDAAFDRVMGKKPQPNAFTSLVVSIMCIAIAAAITWFAFWLFAAAVNDYNPEIVIKQITFGQAFILTGVMKCMIYAGKITQL